MQRRTFVSTIAATGASLATSGSLHAQSGPGTATPTGESAARTGYAPVNGLEMYYEIHGTGEPLVLLHGAFFNIELWGSILSGLAADRQVIAVELQGHGHTADIDRPFSYEQFADDVAALMEHLDVDQADVVGYSMGGNTALQVAIRHPDLVRKLVAVSANYRTDGMYPELMEVIQSLTPDAFAGSPPEAAYFQVAPNPEDWPELFERIKALEATEFAWPDADLQGIEAPTLLVYGDSDSVRPGHMVELFELLGGGVPGDLTGLPKSRLAILPATNHVGVVVERGGELVAMIEEFLAAPMPA